MNQISIIYTYKFFKKPILICSKISLIQITSLNLASEILELILYPEQIFYYFTELEGKVYVRKKMCCV